MEFTVKIDIEKETYTISKGEISVECKLSEPIADAAIKLIDKKTELINGLKSN